MTDQPKVGTFATCAKCGHPIRFNDTDLFGNIVNRWQHTEGARVELGTLHQNTPTAPVT